MSNKLIIGFDPGKSTGYAAFRGADLIETQVISGGYDGFIEWWRDNTEHTLLEECDEIVVERYIPVEGFRGIDQTYSLEIQGAIRALAHVPVALQPRSDKATLFNQEFTGDRGEQERKEWLDARGLGFHTPHEMDAATHVMVNQKRDPDFWNRYWHNH